MPENFKQRVFNRKNLNLLISAAVVTFFVAVILSYHNTLYNEKREKIISNGQMDAIQTANHLDQYFSQYTYVLQFTAYTLKEMLEEGRSQSEIRSYLEKHNKAVSNTFVHPPKSIYGYIRGEYIGGSGWVPPSDYNPAERSWCVNAIANNGNITILDPYIDVRTGKVVMTISKSLIDNQNVVSVDILLDQIQEITEHAVTYGNSDYEIILDSKNMVVAHSDPGEIGKNYNAESGTLGGAILEKSKETSGNYFEIDYEDEHYIVYMSVTETNWRCFSVKNATSIFSPLKLLLWLTIAVLAFVVLLLSYIMTKAYKQYLMSTQLNKRLSSISNIYVGMYEVDIINDRFETIKHSSTFISRHQKEKRASVIMESVVREVADKSSIVDVIRFITIKTLGERLRNTDTTSTEFYTVTHKWIRLRFIMSYREPDGTPSRLLLLAKDITREKTERDALLNVSERAIAANEAKSQFLSNMSHEIRTPINTVLGMNEMILRESQDNYILTYSENIKAAGSALLGLINNILDYSKLESGKIEITPVEYKLSALVNEMANMIGPLLKSKGLALSTSVDETAPKVLYGDENRLKQVIANLLTNAVKYTERGSVTFSIGFQEIENAPNHVMLCVAVKDSGIGIKPEDIEKLFQKFERLDEKRNRNIEGTGLGLPIAQNLLCMMGSSLKVDSVYGLGSKFYFRLRQRVIKW